MSFKLSSKKILALFCGVASVILLTFFSLEKPISEGVEIDAARSSDVQVPYFESELDEGAKPEEVEVAIQPENIDQKYQDSQRVLRALGYVKSSDREVYSSYSDDVLHSLMLDDDPVAAVEYYRRADTMEERVERSIAAITHGVTSPASFLASALLDQLQMPLAENPNDRNKIVDAFSWYQFAFDRGDYFIAVDAKHKITSLGVIFTKSEVAQIKSLATVKMDEFNTARAALGLPPLQQVHDPVYSERESADIFIVKD